MTVYDYDYDSFKRLQNAWQFRLNECEIRRVVILYSATTRHVRAATSGGVSQQHDDVHFQWRQQR